MTKALESARRLNKWMIYLTNLVETAQSARRDCGVFTTTPESIKCVMLQYLDMMHEVRSAPPEVFKPPASFQSTRSRSKAADEAARLRATAKAADLLAELLHCLGVQPSDDTAASGAGAGDGAASQAVVKADSNQAGTGVVLLDEVDLLLNPMLSELNFPIGPKRPLELSPDRWRLPLHIIDAILAPP